MYSYSLSLQMGHVDGSGFGDRAAFMRATGSNGIFSEGDMTVVSGSTADLDSLGGMAFRIFSVDAGHTRELTLNGLTLAACHLAPGGIIVLDDVLNDDWRGVVDGFFSWMHYFPVDFAPFFVGYTKVLICHRDWHRTSARCCDG